MMRVAALAMLVSCGDGHMTIDAASDAAPPAQLVAYYAMDNDPNIAGALDSGGRHLDGNCAIGDCPTLVAGHAGMAYHFDGFNAHLRIPDNGAFRLTHGFSVGVWSSNDGGGDQTLVVKPLAASGESWQLDLTSTGGVAFCTTRSSECLPGGFGALPVQTFVPIALTPDGVTKRIFVAGILVGSGPGGTDFDMTL